MVELVNLLFPGLGLVMVGAAAALVKKGRFYSKQSDRIAETEVSDVGSLHRGTVAVEGTARVAEDGRTVTTALTGEEALVSRSEVVAKDNNTDRAGVDDDTTQGRRAIHEEQRAVPFRVEDDTGSVLVDTPDEADLRLDENVVVEHNRGVPDPADLADDPDAATADEVTVGTAKRWKDRRRRYEQGAIVPGEEVYVLGEAVDRADWDGDDLAIAAGDAPELFLVSDEGRASAEKGGKIGAYIAYGMGAIIGFLGAIMAVFGSLAVIW